MGRLLGLLLIVLILMVTPFAFWVFNLERVALSSQTYRSALQTQNVYNDLLPALVDGAASDSNLDTAHRDALRALLNNMSVDDWATLSDKLLPPSWLQNQVEVNIGRLFDWLDGVRSTPAIRFDLALLKTRLSGPSAQEAVQVVVPKLPDCTSDQLAVLKNASQGQDVGKDFPLCNPQSADLQKTVSTALVTTLNAAGQQLPDHWDLSEQMRKSGTGSGGQRLTEFDLNHFRALVWFQSRITIVLFLVPIALLAMIVLLTIRSAKQFFRWTGWVLIVSGLITLLPVPLMPGLAMGTLAGSKNGIQEGFGGSGRLLASLIGGMVSSIASGLTLAVLIQVAVVIAIGFVAVAISVVLSAPQPEVTQQDLLLEQSQLAAMMASDPFSLGLTPMPAGSTPRPAQSIVQSAGQASNTPTTPPPIPSDSHDDPTLI